MAKTLDLGNHRINRTLFDLGHNPFLFAVLSNRPPGGWNAVALLAEYSYEADPCAEPLDSTYNCFQSGGNERSAMKFFRLYAGADGQSHFEPLDTGENAEFLNKTAPATGFLIRTAFAPHIVNFHQAPRRRLGDYAVRERRHRPGRRYQHEFLSRRYLFSGRHNRPGAYRHAERLDSCLRKSGLTQPPNDLYFSWMRFIHPVRFDSSTQPCAMAT